MLVVDDLLVQPFFGLLKTLQATALEEMYDVEAIRDDIKETQLLYELGELTSEEYERRREQLERELSLAESVHEQLGDRVTVKR